ncbi:EF-hand domain-containing protein [Ruegeria aquimaris]|uniref:EF-hand domain-containing protein n=1 Tax=Ruegeria aquimaris TaxID=2984333 RepID=A0ABT3ANI3_9RHOB|nr:EF-hand domain-containing protein [Ruegeria sp. XHP0148]MCV2890209.1 EF-hand domain-containing protein [Ruegeria sp. XHP0148]
MKLAGLVAGFVLVTAAATASTVWAMGPGAGPRHSFSELDSNGDGKITMEEMQGHRAARFSGVDTDGNGLLSRSELEAEAQSRVSEHVTHMLERLDSNKDGQLSQDEMPQPKKDMGRFFGRIDADGDGAITEEEFAQMQQRMSERHGRHGFGGKQKH